MKCFLIISCWLLICCSSVHKTFDSNKTELKQTDKSELKADQTIKNTIVEIADTTVKTKADTAFIKTFLSNKNPFSQTIKSNNISLKAFFIPSGDGGELNIEAIKLPEIIPVKINKTTTTLTTTTAAIKNNIASTQKAVAINKTVDKKVFNWWYSIWVSLVIGVIVYAYFWLKRQY